MIRCIFSSSNHLLCFFFCHKGYYLIYIYIYIYIYSLTQEAYMNFFKLRNLYYYYYFVSFSCQLQSMVFHWRLIDRKYLQVTRTLLNILANLNNAVIWMVSIRPLIFKSSILIISPLVSVQSEEITIGITITFMFQSFFFSSRARSRYLSFFFSFFFFFCLFYPVISRNGKFLRSAGFFFRLKC